MNSSKHAEYEGRAHLTPSVLFRLGQLIGATTPPTVNGDPAKALAAKTLHSLLFGVMLWLVLFSTVELPFFAARKGSGFALSIALLLSIVTSLFYLNRGHIKCASWIFLSGMWFVATVITMFSGGIASRGLMYYIAISVTAAWLLGQRVALISAGVFGAMSLVLALLESAGVHLPKYFPGSPIVVWMTLLLFTSIAILPVNQVLRALNDALQQAQERVEELKHREQALQESEERCRLAMETGRMFAFEWNPLTDDVRRSADCSDIFGVNGNATREAGKDSLQRIHPEDQEGLIQAVKTLTPAKDSYRTEYRVVHSSGRIVTLQQSARALFDSDGRMVRLVGITADITERKRAEAALRESEDRFRNMADAAPVALWVSGPDGLVSFYNKNALRFTGRTMAQLVGCNWTELVHPDDRSGCHSALSSAMADRRSFRVECRLLRADGEYRWVLCSGVPRFSPDGLLAGFIGSSVDVTELKRAQEEAIARQKLESLGVLAGGIAHDFNNLLGGILAEAELVEEDLPAGSSVGEEIERIKAVAIRGSYIVRELMIYAGHDQTHLVEPLDLSELVEDMLELLKVSISKQAVLKTDLDQNLPAVWGNASQIRRAVMNLVINASEAIGEKEGVIQISTSRVTVGEDSIVINAPNLPTGEYVQLEVSDTGCGMTEEARARIFDPFFTTKFAGRGLGLAVVQGIVRDLGGVVEVVSVDGQGATFRVLLPCTSKRDLRTQSASTSSSAEQSNAPLKR